MRVRDRIAGSNALSADLIDWEVEQVDPRGHVWMAAVMGRDWALFPPGAHDAHCADPLRRVTPAAVRFNFASRRRPRLRRVQAWLVPWVELIAGAKVVDLVEGLAWYGPWYNKSRYVVYLRVT